MSQEQSSLEKYALAELKEAGFSCTEKEDEVYGGMIGIAVM